MIAQFPIVQKLPYDTPYWGLLIDGEIRDGKIPLEATVYVRPNQNGGAEVAKQQEFIEQWIRSTGQGEATYSLKTVTQEIDSY